MKLLLLAMLMFASLPSALRAQRPKTASSAMAAFERVKDQDERNRHGAVRDLGRFDETEVTIVLIQELGRAQSISYQQTVVRAIGYKPRDGVVDALLGVLQTTPNPRLGEAAANAMARQGDVGITALVQQLAANDCTRAQRNAICYALGRLEQGDLARDALIEEVKRAGGEDRLPALRGLAARKSDPAVDALRITLAGDKSTTVASTALGQLAQHGHAESPRLALALARRLSTSDAADKHAAVLGGLLVRTEAEHYDALLFAAAHAEDAFGADQQPGWQRALADETLLKWLGANLSRKKSAEISVTSARALAFCAPAQREAAVSILATLLQEKSAPVVQAAATTLSTFDTTANAQDALTALLKKDNDTTGPIALGALHQLRQTQPGWQQELLALSKSKQAAIRVAALRALATTSADNEHAFAVAEQNLNHREWPVRAAAIELLVATRAKQSPPLLFAMLAKESARMQEDVRWALRDLTGQQFLSLAEWQSWWSKEGATFQPRNGNDGIVGRNGDNQTVSYWNIAVRSDRVSFVVDVSGSMAQPFGTGNATRLHEAKRQLTAVFDKLPKKTKTNMIAFAATAQPLFPKLQALGKKQRKLAETMMAELQPKGPTNVHEALQLAFADPEVDTIFLLTDGRPSVGTIVAPAALADEVQRWNLARSIRIHTIAIGEKSDFLERLAKDSGGEHQVAR